MYAAILDKKLVLAIDEAQLVQRKIKKLNYDEYRCPHCRKKVILIMSQCKNAFFKHLNQYDHALGEKEEHHFSKMTLQAAFTASGFKAQTEVLLAAGQLRADVLVSKNLALEVQCAPLSRDEFEHRHHLYQKINILDLWIVGRRHYLHNQLKKTQLIFFRENKEWGSYYLEIDQAHNILRLKYNVQQEPFTRGLHYQTKNFSLDEFGIKQLWTFKPFLKEYNLDPLTQKRYLARQIKQKSKLGLAIAEKLYQNHLTIDDLPLSVFSQWRKPGETNCLNKFLQNKSA